VRNILKHSERHTGILDKRQAQPFAEQRSACSLDRTKRLPDPEFGQLVKRDNRHSGYSWFQPDVTAAI
jgi:hypothetical protein